MKHRKSFFDDRILYDPKKNELWIGRPDSKWGGEPWDWWIIRPGKIIKDRKGTCFGIPKHLIEIAREPEQTICAGPREW